MFMWPYCPGAHTETHTHAASLATPPVNSHRNISRELLWCGRWLLATHLVIGSIIVFFFAAVFHFGSEAGVEAAWFMLGECAESFSRRPSADVFCPTSLGLTLVHLDIHLSPAAREGKREAASPALLRRRGACDPFPFASSFLAEGAPAGGRSARSWAPSCFNGQMECTVVCAQVCMYYTGRGGVGWGGGVLG